MRYAQNMVCGRTIELTNMRYSKFFPLILRCNFMFCRLYLYFLVLEVCLFMFYVLISNVCICVLPVSRNKR